MTDEHELRIGAALLNAFGFAPKDGMRAGRPFVLAACLHQLATETGLVERDDKDETFSWVAHAGLPPGALAVLNAVLGDAEAQVDDEMVRDGLFDALVAVASEPGAVKRMDRKRSTSRDEFLEFAQVYWNLEATGRRSLLPIRSGQVLSNNLHARIKVPGADQDFGSLNLANRARYAPGYSSEGGAFYAKCARAAALVAERLAQMSHIAEDPEPRFRSTQTRRGIEWSIVWPAVEASEAHPISARPSVAASDLTAGDLESAVALVAGQFGGQSALQVVSTRDWTKDPAHFLAGMSMNPLEVATFAVKRRVDLEGEPLTLEGAAECVASDEAVTFLVAGAGEGKSTYLHAISASLSSSSVVLRWNVTNDLPWSKIETFRDRVASVHAGHPQDVRIVIVGELETKLTPEQEDALIATLQGFPAGLHPLRASILLAGRPNWLNRIRYRVSTGQTLRLLPLNRAEAEDIVQRLERARTACVQARGASWTEARFPNLGPFLALQKASQVSAFLQGLSLVGSLLHASYGRNFGLRLISEYRDLKGPDRAAYLLVSMATSTLGGISRELLATVCPDADIDGCSHGTPWQSDDEGVHRARHEMIGRVLVEDKNGSTLKEITEAFGEIVEAAVSDFEARELLRSSVRILDEPRSLVPQQLRKTEPQFQEALRAGILNNRGSWEQVEETVKASPREALEYSYVLQRLLPQKRGSSETNEYLLQRIENLLEMAESAAAPDSVLRERAQFHRIFTRRSARLVRGEIVVDIDDLKALIPMMSHRWPVPTFYAQILSLGLSTIKNCVLTEDEGDQAAEVVLQAWQRLRVDGDTRPQVAEYAEFVARSIYLWGPERRLGLWMAAWKFSKALGNPDGYLACLIADELDKSAGSAEASGRARLNALELNILGESVVDGQDNAEVVLRLASRAPADDDASHERVLRVAGPLASMGDPVAQAMALHAMAMATSDPESRLRYLRAALPLYAESTINQDDWDTRREFWKGALKTLRTISPENTSEADHKMAAAARRFRR